MFTIDKHNHLPGQVHTLNVHSGMLQFRLFGIGVERFNGERIHTTHTRFATEKFWSPMHGQHGLVSRNRFILFRAQGDGGAARLHRHPALWLQVQALEIGRVQGDCRLGFMREKFSQSAGAACAMPLVAQTPCVQAPWKARIGLFGHRFIIGKYKLGPACGGGIDPIFVQAGFAFSYSLGHGPLLRASCLQHRIA